MKLKMKASMGTIVCLFLLLFVSNFLLPVIAKRGGGVSGKRGQSGGKSGKKVVSAAIPRSKDSKRKASGGFLKEGLLGNIARQAKGKWHPVHSYRLLLHHGKRFALK